MCWTTPALETNISSGPCPVKWQPARTLFIDSDVMKKVHSWNPSGVDFRFSVSTLFFFFFFFYRWGKTRCSTIFSSWLWELASAGSRCTRRQAGSHTFVPKEQCRRCSGLWLTVGTVAKTRPRTCLPGCSTRTDTCTSGSTCPYVCMLTCLSKLGQAA